MNEEIIAKAGQIIARNTGAESYCVIALIDENGYPTASTISTAKSEGINTIYFCTGLQSNKAKRIRQCDKAAVCFNTGGEYNINLVGKIEIITDSAVKAEMWYSGLEQNFSGADDPDFCVLKFTTQRYSLVVDWQEASGTI